MVSHLISRPSATGQDSFRAHVPNCIVAGPQRAGTTWIHRYLLHVPEAGVSERVKEIYYFDRYYRRGLPWYAGHFKPAANKSRIVDVTPTYFHSLEAPQRVRNDLGPVPVVCTLRHPAKRAFSMYLLYRRYGFTRSTTFRGGIEDVPLILDSSRYAANVRRWRDAVGAENVKVLFLEELAKDPQAYASELCSFLGIPFHGVEPALLGAPNQNDALPYNSALAKAGMVLGDTARSLGLYGVIDLARGLGLRNLFFGKPGAYVVPKLSPEDGAWFTDLVRGEIDDLEDMLGVDLSAWRTC